MKQRGWAILLLLVAASMTVLVPSRLAPRVERRADVSADGESIAVTAADEVILEYTIDEWREWAEENLLSVLGGPVLIGPYEQPPSSFRMFGDAALSPDGERLALSATTYALLTTASVIGVLELDQRELSVVEEPAFGGVESFHWAPDGRFIAYPLGTARAAGDFLRVDDAVKLEPVVRLDAANLLEAAGRSGIETGDDPREWMPEVRDLDWSEGRLRFTSNGFGTGELSWSFDPRTGDLSLL
ncbi:MAG TPA: hypothetical protein VF168_13925 [Trueperaceae bacterium]